MKTYIDLLPEGRKNEIKRERNMRIIISQEIRLAFPVIVLVVILSVISIIQKIQIETTDKSYQNGQANKGIEELRMYDEKFREANSNIELVLKVQENHLEWVGALTKLSQLFPEGVFLNGIATKEYRLFLAGEAKKREDLLKFQENIKTSECFTSINTPLSNLVSREDINFQIDFEIKKNCLKAQ